MGQYKNYTNDEFIAAWTSSSSVRQVLGKIGLREAGGNYACAKKKAEELGLSKDHMTGQAWNKGRPLQPKRNVLEYLCNPSKHGISSNALRKRLIAEGIKQHKCECCGITDWNGKPTPIELDHIDGNRYNNTIENLRILCPNCHAQTDTYRGRNKKN
tara:strand:- start:15986 stop:16456 length:471 start_codon:yes stop_codon:yes gene_type:complete